MLKESSITNFINSGPVDYDTRLLKTVKSKHILENNLS